MYVPSDAVAMLEKVESVLAGTCAKWEKSLDMSPFVTKLQGRVLMQSPFAAVVEVPMYYYKIYGTEERFQSIEVDGRKAYLQWRAVQGQFR